jgi:hypothetical protein
MFLELNLPIPSDKIKNEVISLLATQQVNYENHINVGVLNPDINVATCMYFTNDALTAMCKEEFSKLFSDDYYGSFTLCLRNLSPGQPAFYPPHCDNGRIIGINFIINTGGANVETTIYENINDDSSTFEEGLMHAYSNDMIVAEKQRLDESKWYAMDVSRFHSVENIECDRLILSLVLLTKLRLTDFAEKYRHLIKKT